jgi:hypothetical protein
MTNKNQFHRSPDASDGGANQGQQTFKPIVFPRHDFGLNPTFEGRFIEPHKDGFIFEDSNGNKRQVLIPAYEPVKEAIGMVNQGTLLAFRYHGNGQFTIDAPEL